MSGEESLHVAVVAGEESGDLLGADLVSELSRRAGRSLRLTGVGGPHLAQLGLNSLFDPAEIALMGLSAVLARLPSLVRKIGSTARTIAETRPDCLITIDSPDFSLRVARKVRALAPEIPIIHYVCPSVWAWRPQRAVRMAAYVDHVLCLLPFEAEALARLQGPPATYVGHRLAHDPMLIAAAARQAQRAPKETGEPASLLVLPGSRRSEVRRLIGPFRETVEELEGRGQALRLLLPTVAHVRPLVEAAIANWRNRPELILGSEAKYRAFGEADAALAASGTVSLELALAGVPLVACYKADTVGKALYPLITTWSASLPNLIADYPVVPEYYDYFVRPRLIARQLERLIAETPERRGQLEGFARVRDRMATERPAGAIGADAVQAVIAKTKTAPRGAV